MQKNAYAELREIQNKHWWCISRKKIIDSIVSCNLKNLKENEIL